MRENWPLISQALVDVGQASKRSLAVALGTIAIETASTFRPLHEYGTRADWARYDGGADYAGRGFIQLTHKYNYQAYGDRIGVDLVSNPDRAMEHAIAAKLFAAYWRGRDVQEPADRGDWAECRRRVQGAYAGLDRLVQIVLCLLTY